MNDNDDFISCWNEILVPKWEQVRRGDLSDAAF